MKKILTFALCAVAAGSMFAQKEVVDQAAKLSGKNAQLEEARGLIKQAMMNEETMNDARTYYVAGKLEFDAYDNGLKAASINPQDPAADPVAMGSELINGYSMFVKALPLDSVVDAKGKVKAKYSKDIISKIAGHTNDYFNAGANLYNAKQLYPLAYEAFVIYGDMPEQAFLGKSAPMIPDSIRATSYFNAGLCGYYGGNVPAAAKALKKARKLGAKEKDAYVLEIACWQNMMQNDSTMETAGKLNIIDIATDGYKKFGMEQPLFFNNLVNYLVDDEKYDQAIEMVNGELANQEMASLYGLRGFVYDRANKDDLSVADYLKASQMADADFETLKNCAKKIFRVGQEKWNAIEGNSAEARAQRTNVHDNYFKVAKDIATRADQMHPGDGNLQNVIENIDYVLETYFQN